MQFLNTVEGNFNFKSLLAVYNNIQSVSIVSLFFEEQEYESFCECFVIFKKNSILYTFRLSEEL